MSNWFKRSQLEAVRYRGMVIADIVVPSNPDKQAESEMATDLLKIRLSKIEGDASVDMPSNTLVNPTINFTVGSINEYDKLV